MTARPGSAKHPRRSAALGLAVAGLLGVLASVPITGCGGGGERVAEATGITVTRSASTRTTPTRTAPAIETTAPSTTTTPSVSPPVTVTAPAETVTTAQIQTETVVQTTPPDTTTSSSTTTGVNPAAAAAAAAAAASQEDDTTQWGWIAFGILAAAVVVFGVVWWIRTRHATGNGDGGAPTAVSG